MLRQWSPQGHEILYVLTLRMRRRSVFAFRVGRQERVGRVTMVNLDETGTIRLVYLQSVNQWDQLHPLAISQRSVTKSCLHHHATAIARWGPVLFGTSVFEGVQRGEEVVCR